jgi:tyrosinase
LVIHSSLLRVYNSDGRLDAPDFYGSSFWDSDPESGLGGWGNPSNDYQIQDGGLSDFMISYPIPHHIRRNFTNLVWANIPSPLITDPQAVGNLSFTGAVIEAILETPPGEYEGFQKTLEAIQVRNLNIY